MTRADISKLAIDAGVSIRGHYDETGSTPAELQRFAELVAAAEREECAKVCQQAAEDSERGRWTSRYAAAECRRRIRARGEKGQS